MLIQEKIVYPEILKKEAKSQKDFNVLVNAGRTENSQRTNGYVKSL